MALEIVNGHSRLVLPIMKVHGLATLVHQRNRRLGKTRRITLSIPTILSHNPAVFQTPKQAISLTTLKSTRALRMMLSPLCTRRQWSTALLKDVLLITPCSNQVNL